MLAPHTLPNVIGYHSLADAAAASRASALAASTREAFSVLVDALRYKRR